MRKLLGGLAVATALSLAPATAAVAADAPAPKSTVQAAKASTGTVAKAKPGRSIAVKDLPGRDARLRLTVKPEFGRKYLKIQRFEKGRFVNKGSVRTNGKGVAVRVFQGKPGRGWRYRVIAVGGAKYATSYVAFNVRTVRV